ncbi:MAG: cell division protein FtsQ/DivIB [Geitlerinemataceae cyanobacterium]
MRVEPFSVVSPDELDDRRRQLRRQRGFHRLKGVARLLAIAALTTGAIALIRQPGWTLRDSSAIDVSGNRWLPDDTVRALLDLDYPQSLLHLDPNALAQRLSTSETISDARIARELLPPGLSVWVQERQPVAIAYPANTPVVSGSVALPSRTRFDDRLGLIDASGQWMTYKDYVERPQMPPLPTLATLGDYDDYKHRWTEVYAELSRSSVAIAQIDWRDARNVILSTEIGTVHLGAIGARLPEQIVALDRLRNLPQQVGADRILYIDLSDPRAPYIQVPKSPPAPSADPEGQS